MKWLKEIFNITTDDLKSFLKLSFFMIVCFVAAGVLFSFSWGAIPAIIFLALGGLLATLIWLMFFPWV